MGPSESLLPAGPGQRRDGHQRGLRPAGPDRPPGRPGRDRDPGPGRASGSDINITVHHAPRPES
jgi:hypothetical protein